VCACKVNYTFLAKSENGVNNTWREASFGKFNRKVLNFMGSVKEVQFNGFTKSGQLNVQGTDSYTVKGTLTYVISSQCM